MDKKREEKEMEIITVINQKGGVGKTVTAHALGAGLKRRGKKVLYVDLDPQGNLSFALGAVSPKKTAFNLFMKDASLFECVTKTLNADVICSSPNLAAVQTLLVSEIGTESILKEAFKEGEAEKTYDYVIIDTPPALSLQTVNALTLSDKLIIPTQADIFGLQGIGQLFKTIEQVKKYYNPNLYTAGILLVRFKKRTSLSKQIFSVLEDTAAKLNTKIFETKIRDCIAVAEVQGLKSDIFTYAPKSNAALDYDAFVDEFLKDGEKNAK